MTVDFEDESGGKLELALYDLAQEVISCSLDVLNCPYEVSVSLLITEDEKIHEINLEQRGIDRPTDVLSFPVADYETPGDFEFLEKEGAGFFDPESGELLLGDIVISADRVAAQAQEYGHSTTREYAFLIAHSMLHLVGYDHMTQEDAAQMEAIQREILGRLGIMR